MCQRVPLSTPPVRVPSCALVCPQLQPQSRLGNLGIGGGAELCEEGVMTAAAAATLEAPTLCTASSLLLCWC